MHNTQPAKTTPHLGAAVREYPEPLIAEQLYDQMHESVAVCTTLGQCLYVNPTTEKILGKTRREVIGRVLWELFSDATNDSFQQAFNRVAASGQLEEFEYFHRAWGRWFNGRIFRAHGQVWVISSDTTAQRQALEAGRVAEQKEMLEAVHRGQAQLRLVTDALPVLVAFVGADQCYRFVNSTFEKWFGKAPSEVLGRSITEVLGEEAFKTIRPYVEAALSGKAVTFEASVPNQTYQTGGPHFVKASYFPHLNAEGAVEGYVSLVWDITEEKTAREEREKLLQLEKEARERVAVLAHASQVLAGSLDYEVTLRNVVGLALPLLGDFGFFDVVESEGQVRRIAAAQDARQQAILDQIAWARSDRKDLNLCALSSGESGLHSNIDDAWLQNVVLADGHLRGMRDLAFCSMITVPLTYQERTLGSLTLFYGDSKRRHSQAEVQLAEELARRAAAAVENSRLFKEAQEAVGIRDDFLSVAGHELRTPLTAVQLQLMAVVRMLDEGQEVKTIAPRAQKAARNLTRFSTLVNQLLDISRISAGRLTLEKTTFDLSEAVREVLDRSSEELARASCALQFKSDGPAVGTWDRLRIEQVVTNLLSNAIKYGKGKPIEVSVATDGSTARLDVRDGGIGISIEDQKRVFQRFERAVSSRHFGGMGLGLWVSRQLVEAHAGAIRVESAPEQGAQFMIDLPLGAQTASVTAESE